jgi:hypothetical protein
MEIYDGMLLTDTEANQLPDWLNDDALQGAQRATDAVCLRIY